MYTIIEFMNKDNRADISVISDAWLSVSGHHVYCPPPTIPTLILAKSHSTPASSWGKCDVTHILFKTSKCSPPEK